MVSLILQSLYFFLPGYVANMSPILFKWIPFLGIPIHEQKFGKNKTWRGIIVAAITGMIIFLLQRMAYQQGFVQFALIDYNDFSILFGLLMGLGVILGDLVKSYYKRKNNIAPGEPWMPWDQLDFVIGGILGVSFFYVPAVEVVFILLLFSPILHLLVNYLGYILKIKKNKF
ncbi:CDP-archaeol synthase [Candidatus Woesearchaeota archaeon]|nr:CDP-archaeol synthase [Candidatus Woesearchaeota archaeon]